MTSRPPGDTPATRVVYIGGTGRSGSTMLANVLGELDGLVSAGEVRFLWERGILQNRLCGCGEPFAECGFWSAVVDLALGPASTQSRRELATRMHGELLDRTRLRTLPGHLRSRQDAPDELTAVLSDLYAAIATVSGASAVVDSSKLPTYASLLTAVDSLDLSVVHFVRDPRAAAHSWRRHKHQPDLGADAMMERRGAVKSAALWTVWNSSLAALWRRRPDRYLTLTYEDFLNDPQGEVRRIADRFDLDVDTTTVFADRDVVRLSVHHTVAGNPSRHQHGLVSLVPDSEWKAQMQARDRWAVTALSAPALRRYGYRIRP